MKLISVVMPCYNEEENVREAHAQVKQVFAGLEGYSYEHLFIDNASEDRTVLFLKEIAKNDPAVRIIVNVRNFGHIRSPYHALLHARGDAVVVLAADLQDPPALIADFIKRWEEGYKVVMGVKTQSEESPLFFAIRRTYYRVLQRLSDVEQVENATGFGLYDRYVVEVMRQLNDPYPYVRGMIGELGFPVARVSYLQPARKRGITKNNLYTLYDMAMLGLTSHSKVPLRLAAMVGFMSSILSAFVALFYLVYKLLFWSTFTLGLAPAVVGLFFFSSVQLFFLGVAGEYVGAIHTQILRRPLVIEKERINFD